jgi:hypothetical protein
VLALGITYAFLLIPAAVTPSIVADGGETEVAVAMIPASVSGRAPGSEVVWLGEIGPEPQFDTSALGPDLTLGPVDPDVEALELLEGIVSSERHADIVVYMGEHEGELMYLFSIAPPSVWDLLSEYVTGNWSGRIYGTSVECCSSMAAAHVPPEGVPGAGSWARTNEAGVIESGGHLQWLALPPDTAVVSLSAGGIDLGWQRPIGRAAMLPLDASHLDDDGLVVNPVMVAYAADGSELARYSPEGEFEPAESTRVLPTLADLSVAHHCNYGFWLGNESGTVGLRLEYDSRAALDESFPPRETVTLPHPDWDAYLVFGEYLYINWCDDIIEEDEPTPVEDERMKITGGSNHLGRGSGRRLCGRAIDDQCRRAGGDDAGRGSGRPRGCHDHQLELRIVGQLKTTVVEVAPGGVRSPVPISLSPPSRRLPQSMKSGLGAVREHRSARRLTGASDLYSGGRSAFCVAPIFLVIRRSAAHREACRCRVVSVPCAHARHPT